MEKLSGEQLVVLVAWAEGRYALGWRGWLAQKLLRPAINEVLAEDSNAPRAKLAPNIKL